MLNSLPAMTMKDLPIPMKTERAMHWLHVAPPEGDRLMQVLLSEIDGHRNVIELESFARAVGLDADALERLRRQGLIDLAAD